jgi:predicted component of type VI protein secretion system
MKEDEDFTPEKLEGAVRALRRVHIRRRLEQIQRQMETTRALDADQLKSLMDEKLRLKRALMNPGLGGDEVAASAD